MRPRRRLLIAVFGAFAVALLTGTLIPIGLLSAGSHRDSYLAQRLFETESVAASLRGRSEADRIRVVKDRYPVGSFTAGWLLDRNGDPLTEPTRPDAYDVAPADAPEVRRAVQGPDGRRFGPAGAGERLYIAVPVIEDGTLRNVVWISSSTRPVRDLDRRSWVLLGGIGITALVGALGLGFAVAGRLSRRVEALAAAADRFGEGDLNQRFEIPGRDEIAQLAKRLDEMATSLRRSLAREKEFVSAASHQIRTPLTTIRLRLEAIATRLQGGDDETREYLTEMIAEIDRLSALSSKLLQLGAAGSRLEDAVTIKVPEAVRGTWQRLDAVAARRGIRLLTEGPPVSVLAPPGVFEEVLMNLLDNAIKFSPDGLPVAVAWSEDAGIVRLTVQDRGPGIAADVRSRVFDAFFSHDRRQGGHGLGLTVSRRLALAAGARLTLESAQGEGTTAIVEWPAAGG